ncbi:MAG: chorismate-binding protein [Candidatus Peribacteraceae bacterium]|nr:chorismate-binding protein [Candidatus Peribacteraceae bacterium]
MIEKKILLPGFHPRRFFSKLRDSEKSVAYFTSGQWTIIAWNPSTTIEGDDASVFEKLRIIPARTSSLPFPGGVIGYCSYELGLAMHGVKSRHRSSLAPAVFHVYEQAVLWNGKEVFVVGDESFQKSVEVIHLRPFSGSPIPSLAWHSTMTKRNYRKKFTAAMRGIWDGEFYQLNLSYPFVAETTTDPRKLFAALAETNPAPCASFFEHDDLAIISLSPERFVTIDKGIITTRPIKGTRPRGSTPAADKRLVDELLASSKEAAELTMITDLLRNDVGKVSAAGSVKVLEHRALQKNPSVWHTYSVVRGTLEKNLHPVDAFVSMFPGGSVTGCPKVAAMKEIDRLEDHARGAYCGSMLMVGKNGVIDSTILIRTIVKHKNRLSLGMGGGIVADSDAVSEYDETLKKAQSFLTFSDLQSACYYRRHREIPAESVTELFDLTKSNSVGVFETMRANDGKIEDLPQHLKRLASSAALLGIKIPSKKILAKYLRHAMKKHTATLRLKIICTKKDTVIETRPLLTDPARTHGIGVTILDVDRAIPEAKALPYHREYAAHHEAGRKGFGEALLRRSDGSVGEGAYSNIFFVKDGTLWTAEHDVLLGITRARVIKLARRLGLPVRFVSLQETDIWHAEEIFLTSSLTGITPIIRLNTERVGTGQAGKLTKRLQKAFDAERV